MLGKIVFYKTSDGRQRPAIVTQVWSEECLNLHVLDDGSYRMEEDALQTSVTRGTEIGQWLHWVEYDMDKVDNKQYER